MAIDPITNEEIYNRELAIKNDINLYDMYKKEKGLLQRYEIKNIQEKYDLSQKDFSIILGLDETSIERYENGTIQTYENDVLIRSVLEPHSMERLVYKNKDKVTKEVFERILRTINELETKY